MRAVRAAHAVTCIALASALCVPAFAAQFDYYLKVEGVDGESTADKGHKNEIEILSWSWGATNPATAHHGGGMGAGKVNVHDISVAPEPQAGKVSKVEAINIKQSTTAATDGEAARANDRLRTAGPTDGWPGAQAGEAEITLKGEAAEAKKRPGRVKYGDITLKRGATAEPAAAGSGGVSVAAGDLDGDGRAEAAKHKSGSLTYLNRTRQKELGRPAPSGSVTLLVPTGHGLCTAGKGLGTLTLAGSGMKPYVLKGATIVGCAAAEGGSRPMETITMNYTKIEY